MLLVQSLNPNGYSKKIIANISFAIIITFKGYESMIQWETRLGVSLNIQKKRYLTCIRGSLEQKKIEQFYTNFTK